MFTNKQNKPKNLIQDSFEKVTELGIDIARQAVREITKTFNPLAANFENPTRKERESGNQNFSELDFDKLQKQYDHQDSSQLDAVRSQIGGGENTPNPK